VRFVYETQAEGEVQAQTKRVRQLEEEFEQTESRLQAANEKLAEATKAADESERLVGAESCALEPLVIRVIGEMNDGCRVSLSTPLLWPTRTPDSSDEKLLNGNELQARVYSDDLIHE
jgi:Tropomyosin